MGQEGISEKLNIDPKKEDTVRTNQYFQAMKRTKILILSTALLFTGNSTSWAGIEPSDWSYTSSSGFGSGTVSNSITMISPNPGVAYGSTYVEYKSIIPSGVTSIDVPWVYKSEDVNGPWFDLPEYLIISGGTTVKSGYLYFKENDGNPDSNTYQGRLILDLSSYGGSSLVFRLNARDSQLGSATLSLQDIYGFEKVKKPRCLDFSKSTLGSEKVCDGDGTLRKILDNINSKYK